MTVFFTSDPHFGHENIIKYTDRPFRNTDEMDKFLMENINKRVGKTDTLYILGDIAFGSRKHGATNLQRITELRKQIVCDHVHLILGNHDPRRVDDLLKSGFESVGTRNTVNVDGARFVCDHFPLMEWDGYYHGAYHLHGHIHADPTYNADMRERGILRYDVGVDANCYAPVSAKEILGFFDGVVPSYQRREK